ncbi:NADPH:quinone reductase [Hyphomonas sp.]|uniref:NADPH:quinone reductase n=1 Tax=Hyphomonas sp. TaxID=87 RepID=UPI003002FA8D
MTMKAVWYEATGTAEDVLQFGEMSSPDVGAGEVLVRMKTSGVNPSDVKSRAGMRGPIPFPRVIPHSDGAGIIEAVGEGIDSSRIGQRVWIWNAAWRRAFGTCSELLAIPSAQAVPLPDNTGFDAGACLGIPASTAYHGVFSDGSVEGQTILVTGGAGAVGHYAIQLAKYGGAHVITTVSGDAKAAHAKSAGAEHIINYKTESVTDKINDLTGGAGVDRVIEVEFGGNLSDVAPVLKAGAVIATYGSMADPKPSLPFYDLMFKNVTLKMYLVYLLSDAARKQTVEGLNAALASGKISHAIAKRIPLKDTAKAHEIVEAASEMGNIVIDI